MAHLLDLLRDPSLQEVIQRLHTRLFTHKLVLRILFQVLGDVAFSTSGNLPLHFGGHLGDDLLIELLYRVIVAFLAVMVFNLDHDDLRLPRLSDVEELVSMVATEGKDLVF